MRFRPCIDLHNGKVKQIVGSTLTVGATTHTVIPEKASTAVTNFETEQPASFFAGLYRNNSLPGGHVIMLGPGNEQAAADALRAFPGGLHIGGGITPENARKFLDAGASHVIVTSFVFSGGAVLWQQLGLLEKTVGKKHLVLDLSCRYDKTGQRYMIACDCWQTDSGVALTQELMGQLAGHCDEFLVHAVDVEGKRKGIDAGLVRFLSGSPVVPTTYAGGIRSIDDLEEVRTLSKGRLDATIGSALDIFGGTLSYAEVVKWQRKQEKK
jgi:phosphoribosylformimino-5-aminoimidazole carboxamide ribotide isomerase